MTADGARRLEALTIVLFVALFATAIALGPALAHAFELPNKIDLPVGEYFIVQQAYRGWNKLAFVLLVQVIAIVCLLFIARHDVRLFRLAAIAALGLVGAQVLFWTLTYPANVETENWTSVPANWQSLRNRWEYSHAGGAVFQLMTMTALILAALARRSSRIRKRADDAHGDKQT